MHLKKLLGFKQKIGICDEEKNCISMHFILGGNG
jgi:hypothetical protein